MGNQWGRLKYRLVSGSPEATESLEERELLAAQKREIDGPSLCGELPLLPSLWLSTSSFWDAVDCDCKASLEGGMDCETMAGGASCLKLMARHVTLRAQKVDVAELTVPFEGHTQASLCDALN
jgi:hypothetical protein